MTNHEFDEPSPLKERLAAAKAAFRGSVLQNDTLFSVLQARLVDQISAEADLPDFGLEPTLRRNEDGTSTIGLRISRSATSSGGVMGVYVGIYDYLPLGQLDRTTGSTKITPELEAALAAIGKEKTDALGILRAWQAGVGEMCAQFTEPLMLDPTTDTFELKKILMARNYNYAVDPER